MDFLSNEQEDLSLHATLSSNQITTLVGWNLSSNQSGSVAMINDHGINVFQIKSLETDYTSVMSHDVTLLPNLKDCPNLHVGIATDTFHFDPSSFPGGSSFTLDAALTTKTLTPLSLKGYVKAEFSPPISSQGFRSLLATVGIDGSLHINCLKELTGKWVSVENLTALQFSLLSKKEFEFEGRHTPSFDDTVKNASLSEWKYLALTNSSHVQDQFIKYKNRRYHLFTMTVCWSPVVRELSGQVCNSHSPIDTKRFFLVSGTKDGYLVFWMLEMTEPNIKLEAQLLCEFNTGFLSCPTAMTWFQEKDENKGYLVVALADGTVHLYKVKVTSESGTEDVSVEEHVKMWPEKDDLLVHYVDGFLKDEKLQIVVPKEMFVVVFDISIASSGELFVQHRVSPQFHNGPIIGLSFMKPNKVFSTSYDGTIATLDLTSSTLKHELCSSVGKEGYCCCGFTVLPGSYIGCVLLTPQKLLLKQLKYLRKSELLFIPLVTLEEGASLFIDSSERLSIEAQEFFRVLIGLGAEIPSKLLNFAAAPETSEHVLETRDYQKCAFLAWLFQVNAKALKEAGIEDDEATKEDFWTEKVVSYVKALVTKVFLVRLRRWDKFVKSRKEKLAEEDKKVLQLHIDFLSFYCKTENWLDSIITSCEWTPYLHANLIPDRPTDSRLLEGTIFLFKDPSLERASSSEGTNVRDTSFASNKNTKIVRDLQKGPPPMERGIGLGAVSFPPLSSRETCVLCGKSIQFTNLFRDKCFNGHYWNRCCLTLTILSEFKCRQCNGCGRFALRKPPKDTGLTFKSLLLDESSCPYCNGVFVTPL